MLNGNVLKIPKLPKTILSQSNAELESLTKQSMTDYGLCTVINGDVLRNSYSPSNRTRALSEFFDNRTSAATPIKIEVGNTFSWSNVDSDMQLIPFPGQWWSPQDRAMGER